MRVPACYLRLYMRDGTYKDVSAIERAVFTKDYYLPCSKLRARAVLPPGLVVYPYNVKRVELFISTKKLHNGIPDVIKTVVKGKVTMLEVESRGVTVTLCQTEPEPGIWTSVDLKNVVDNGKKTNEITAETGTTTVGYVNILEKSSAWDAICLYAEKAYGTYPYVKGTSRIMVTKSTDIKQNSTSHLISTGRILDTRQLLTNLYMQDVSGEYTYTAEDSFSLSYGITRERYYPLDQRWLHDEEKGMRMKLLYSERGALGYSLTYAGYSGEDITDKVSFTGIGSLSGLVTVGALRIEILPVGIITTVTQYSGGFF